MHVATSLPTKTEATNGQQPTSPPFPSLLSLAEALFQQVAHAAAESPLPRPASTYRLQLHHAFRFEDVIPIIDYLSALGVTDLYLSPFLTSRTGSTHGYDIIDHARINPEIGDVLALDRLTALLKGRGMTRVLDIVPNHMGFSTSNPYLLDVLENGPQSQWSCFFDIDWHPIERSLEGRLLLPILEDLYGKVLEAGQIFLEREAGAFWLRYHDHRLPVRPQSYSLILGAAAAELKSDLDGVDDQTTEFLSILDSIHCLPQTRFANDADAQHLQREKEVIKRRLGRLLQISPGIRSAIDRSVSSFRGRVEDPASFQPLHELLEQQAYRLAFWRVASQEINYRRFFDVTELIGIRVEDPSVFNHVHRLIVRWVREGGVSALRVDHPDGLSDPLGYFQQLQETLFLSACHDRLATLDVDLANTPWPELSLLLSRLYRRELHQNPTSPLHRRFPIIAEKILSGDEQLSAHWPIDGTVGYEFLNALNGLFVDPAAEHSLTATYRHFTGDEQSFAEVLHQSKLDVEELLLPSELNTLSRLLDQLSETGLRTRDFTHNDLHRVLIEVVACFRVYRTYIRPGDEISVEDRAQVHQAVSLAQDRLPAIDPLVFDFFHDLLVATHPPDVNPLEKSLRERFALRFQQTTGPVQAKGLEDTAFYRQYPLLSLNEVGADPNTFGTAPTLFHAFNKLRLSNRRGGFSPTSTHDTKRGEDARIRIDVISEFADEWKSRLALWSGWNSSKTRSVAGKPCPDPREEYLLYQTLIGAWPLGATNGPPAESFIARVCAYMVKAVSEAKRNTSWIDRDPCYKETLSRYVASILSADNTSPFLGDFLEFQQKVARIGLIHSLSQTLLKLASPGASDIYQGNELWDFSMVDPDNRRPVDYALRSSMLQTMAKTLSTGGSRDDLAQELLASPNDGAVKLYLTSTLLNHRDAHRDLYLQGAYTPLQATGLHHSRVVAFARSAYGQTILAIAPRLVAPLMGDRALLPPIGLDAWGDTEVILPRPFPVRWRNLLNDQLVESHKNTLPLATLFKTFPFALLVEQPLNPAL